jgi:ribosomal protein S18 acetylase RimI-like enzyme
MLKVTRYFLELKSNEIEIGKVDLPQNVSIFINEKKKYEINKFFYKQVGADHYWRDRLVWTDKEWLNYVSNNNFETWILKKNKEIIGFYEQEFHPSSNEVELINMGILKDNRGQKLGSTLLLHAISNAFNKNPNRMWVHTCSLDHKHALNNYIAKGFKIFKEEQIDFIV